MKCLVGLVKKSFDWELDDDEEMGYLKTGYVLTNQFFMSQSAKERLTPFYAVAAL